MISMTQQNAMSGGNWPMAKNALSNVLYFDQLPPFVLSAFLANSFQLL